jgi:hypothetical protein
MLLPFLGKFYEEWFWFHVNFGSMYVAGSQREIYPAEFIADPRNPLSSSEDETYRQTDRHNFLTMRLNVS